MGMTITHADVDAAARWLGDVEFEAGWSDLQWVADNPMRRRAFFSEARHRLREQAALANRDLPEGGRRIANSVPLVRGHLTGVDPMGGGAESATVIVEPGRVVGFLPTGPRPAYEWRGAHDDRG